jgi:hypothetical protein
VATREERTAAKAADKAAKEEEKQRRRFDASPAGKARAAYQNGDGWFEVELDLRDTGGLLSHGGSGADLAPFGMRHKPRAGRMDVLSQIESEGWELAHVGYVFVETGSDTRDKWMASGQRAAVAGKIVGIYLFRRGEQGPGDARAGEDR